MPRNDEPTFNRALAEVLRTRNPRWQDIGELLGAEQLDVLREGGRPDIFVDDPDGAPIIIETEYAPARTVELEAQSRLNKTTKETGKIIEQAIALCAPDSLRNVTQDKLVAAVRTTTFKYCLYSANALSQGNDRWPTSGWLEGSVNDLAQLIEIVSVSERAVAASLETLEQGIVAASGRLQQATRDRPQIRQKIADYLHQEEGGEQTSRMAMAIVANAITFHTIIAGTHNVQTVDELRTSNGILPKGVVLREWSGFSGTSTTGPYFTLPGKSCSPCPMVWHPRYSTSCLRSLANLQPRVLPARTTCQAACFNALSLTVNSWQPSTHFLFRQPYLLSLALQDLTSTGPIQKPLCAFGSEILLRVPAHSSRRRIAAYWLVTVFGEATTANYTRR